MPLRPRCLFLRAWHCRVRHVGPTAALLLTITLSTGTGLPATLSDADAAARAPAPALATSAGKPSTTAQPTTPIVVGVAGTARDPLGRIWVRTDIGGNGAVSIRQGADHGNGPYRAELVGGSGWWLPKGHAGTHLIPFAWSAGATGTTLAVFATGADGQTSNATPITILGDDESPVATLDTLAVEQGELTLRWRATDGAGSGIVRRGVRIEAAAASPTGCGTFTVRGGMPVGAGDDDEGVLSLGRPPSTGCLRVSLELTDRVGHTSVTAGQPFRIQPAPAAAAKRNAVKPWTGRYNLYRAGAFVTQKTFKWCVAASIQMMVNLVRHRSDRSTATQARMIAYAQREDEGPYGEGGGTDLTGWTTALRHFGAGRYRAVGSSTAAKALRIAATAMRQTGRPAGILVMDGRHAWVLHGFESKTDPRRDPGARITAVRISGPLYPLQQKNGYDPRPNTRLPIRTLERYFTPSSVGALAGKYVVVIPTH